MDPRSWDPKWISCYFLSCLKDKWAKTFRMFERDLVAKGCNTYKHCVIAIIVRIWILNLSCLRSERKSAAQARHSHLVISPGRVLCA